MLRIAIYTRKSVFKENSESIDTQIELSKKYFQGSHHFEVFIDEGFSGGNTNRPAFKKMMNMIKLRKFDIVATYKIDRISRNIVDFVGIYEDLKNNNVKLVSITEGFDTTTVMGEMMMFILSAFANMERENIKERVKDNMIALAKKGCFTGGFVPFGCEIEKKEGKSYLTITDEKTIQLIFNKYLELKSLYALKK
ncbi:MAG: recombinase family protein, partial [Clostridia bacterium]